MFKYNLQLDNNILMNLINKVNIFHNIFYKINYMYFNILNNNLF